MTTNACYHDSESDDAKESSADLERDITCYNAAILCGPYSPLQDIT